MAGSEKLSKSGVDPKSEAGFQALYTNFSLAKFSEILCNMEAHPKNGKKGGQVKAVWWKHAPITKMMKSVFDGTAFSAFIICCS